ncbi:hypothetical protein D9757_000124 [Collybiopsis confluens]|uniref:N-end rule aminoacyl transferase C-terminal domain-containing protein n=1 Tax=Collybiopsis confluens TaxID=2823264 RepID=A0A8H5I2I7_9AGAR|nr:hypothetical protein D9757_000124 [Collybiopsis confluens]
MNIRTFFNPLVFPPVHDQVGTLVFFIDVMASSQHPFTDWMPQLSNHLSITRSWWNKFVQHAGTQKQSKQRGRENAEFDLISAVHASEYQSHQDPPLTHRYEMTLEPSSYTDEKYQLFQKYQAEIHHDPSTSGGFNRFLVESPLFQEAIPYTSPPPDHLPTHYGSYHWCYRLDGELIAISVIDILPTCVSSVYFMYDKEYEAHSLGKLSALREIALTQELHRAGAPSLNFLYLGYYIHSCQKMRYKGEYQPSYLSDPVECLSAHCFDWECQLKLKFFQETHEWHPFGECSKLLNEFRYACFSHPERSIRGEPGSELVQEFKEYDPHEQDFEDIIGRVCVVSDISGARVSVRSAKLSPEWSSPVYKNQLLSCVEELGGELASRILFQL